jgi:hypothetical protein
VGHREREKLSAQDHQSFECFVPEQSKLGDGASGRCLDGLVEDVGKPSKELVVGSLRAIHRHIPLGTEPEDPEIVRSVEVICMQVCDPDGIDVIDSLPDELEAQLRGGIHQQPSVWKVQEGAVPCPPVPWVVRRASRAMAPDDGDSERGSRTEKCELHAGLLRRDSPEFDLGGGFRAAHLAS